MSFHLKFLQVKVWFQNRRMKHKRQTLSKTDEEDNKDSLKGDDDSQPCSKFISPLVLFFSKIKNPILFHWWISFCFHYFFYWKTFKKTKQNYLEDALTPDSSSKKSCQGCELPSHDIPDSTSNSRGHNNNTPSATNNNNNNNNSSKTLGNGEKHFWSVLFVFG